MWRVILPLAGPGLATTVVLCFLEDRKEFMLALTFMNDEARKTLPVVVFILLRKHLMTGTTAGAVKG